MDVQPDAVLIARFLQAHPEFFVEHAETFSNLSVPHPNQNRAISLGERQILILRDRLKDLEIQLSTLSYRATFNDSVSAKINQWCTRMLSEPDAQRLPGHITVGLAQIFGLTDVALRVWDIDDLPESLTDHVTDDIKALAASLTGPYAGPTKNEALHEWLQAPPASVALIPLHVGTDGPVTGLLMIASDDPQRYTEDMATDFLEHIGKLASAALARLMPETTP
ncbi:DUF484 family protein [Orrella sp. 11846]|uniref:DUF484 family protein n=1 Tax=Orrella sp. 11846 TaxID=3409913 RepID=UPI003B5BA2CB